MATRASSADERAQPAGRRADRSRRAIVAAARDCFLSEGYDISMDRVAAAAGVSKVTVYNHFGSKQALFTAVVGDALDEALADTLASARARVDEAGDAREALVSTARAWVDGVVQAQVLALRNLVTGELRRFPELGRAWDERGPGQFLPMLTGVLKQLVERGELRIDKLEVAAIQLLALTLYPHLVFSSYGGRVPTTAEALIEDGVDMFLGHYGAGADG